MNNTKIKFLTDNKKCAPAINTDAHFYLGWFSCGITSAVACKIALQQFPQTEFYYIEIDSAHPDNNRFIADCEKWYGKKITRIKSKKFNNQFEVIKKERYINGPTGARCTRELKKEVRYIIEKSIEPNLFNARAGTLAHQIFGFEFSIKEIGRALDFELDFSYTNPIFPLIENRLTKNNCAKILLDAGIDLPQMYNLGYSNNNCIGCVKGGRGYWNKIRNDFPETFLRMAKLEREIKRSCIKGVFLDELKPAQGRAPRPVVSECGVFCENILPPAIHKSKAERIFYGLNSIE